MCAHSGKIAAPFTKFEGFILDIEGVIIRGDLVVPLAIETVNTLMASKPVIFLSNISDHSREDLALKLEKMGFVIPVEKIMTSGYATIIYLKDKYPDHKRCYVLGAPSFKDELTRNGFEIVNSAEDTVDLTIVGLDYEINYQKICDAATTINNGSRFIATNLARTKLTSWGCAVGPGFTVKGLEYITGLTAELMGKPSSTIFHYCLKELGLTAQQVLMTGDKLEQDVYGGNFAGLSTCLVLSGATSNKKPDVPDKIGSPDFIIENVGKLIEI